MVSAPESGSSGPELYCVVFWARDYSHSAFLLVHPGVQTGTGECWE